MLAEEREQARLRPTGTRSPSKKTPAETQGLTNSSSAIEAGGTDHDSKKDVPPASVRWSAWLGSRLQSGLWMARRGTVDSGGGMMGAAAEDG